MKLSILASVVASAAAFSPSFVSRPSTALFDVPLANGSMSFNRVCREWRCKYTGNKADSESLEAIAKEVEKVLPAIKGVSDDITVNRLVCGSCLDFKLMMTVPLDDFGPWEEKGYVLFHSMIFDFFLFSSISQHSPFFSNIRFEPESDFLEAIKAIDGVSQVETQTITNMEVSLVLMSCTFQ